MKTAKEAVEHLSQYIKKVEQVDQWINIAVYQGEEIIKHKTAKDYVENGELSVGEQYTGKLHEILSYLPKYLDTILDGITEDDTIIINKNNVMKAFLHLKACLNEDQHLLLDYMRHSYTHIFQGKYDWEPNKKIKIESLDRKEIDIEKANDIIQFSYGQFAKVDDRNQDRVAQYWLANQTLVAFKLLEIQWRLFVGLYVAGDYRKYLISKFHNMYEKSQSQI